MALGAKPNKVNANVFKVYFGAVSDANEYILAMRKEQVIRTPQKRYGTGAGPVYFTMLSDDRLLLDFIYTTDNFGSADSDWNKLMTRNTDSGEVPTEKFFLVAADAATPQVKKTHAMECKAEELRTFGEAEGGTLAKMILVITDNNVAIT